MKQVIVLLLSLALTLSLAGCRGDEDASFAGFTFGGGGNTVSAEPATLRSENGLTTLEAGTPSSPVYLNLTWASKDNSEKQELQLSSAQVKVKEKGAETELKEGSVVLQSTHGEEIHGSFELTTQSEDGREFEVVGSFIARKVE